MLGDNNYDSIMPRRQCMCFVHAAVVCNCALQQSYEHDVSSYVERAVSGLYNEDTVKTHGEDTW